MDLKNFFGPLGFIAFGWIPSDSLVNFVLQIIPCAIIPEGMSGLQFLTSVLQILSLSAGFVWIIVQVYLKWPDIIKRFKSRRNKHGN